MRSRQRVISRKETGATDSRNTAASRPHGVHSCLVDATSFPESKLMQVYRASV